MSSIIILINNTQNPKGRSLVQIDRTLTVSSECCGGSITKRGVGIGYEDICQECESVIGFNKQGWDSTIRNIGMNTTSKTAGSRWPEWAMHWFGLEDFEIEVTE